MRWPRALEAHGGFETVRREPTVKQPQASHLCLGGPITGKQGMEQPRVRIQPQALPISADEPFVNDLLGREESAKVLTRIVSGIEGPCVLALDAPWGYGKTTFLDMWAKWLRLKEQGFPVVACFNAWETDFTHHPFLALSSELIKELESAVKTAPIPGFNTFKRAGKKLLRAAIPAIPQLAGSLMPGGGAAVEAVLSVFSAAVSDKADTNDYLEAKEAIASFQTALEKLAQGLDKPLVIMIDELDRCRPSYAIELLEVAKHFFAVDNVVFVLAVNRSQMVHSVKVLYGTGFCAEDYLRRFFDLDFQLPKPDRKPFVEELLRTTKLTSTLVDREAPKVLLETFLGSPRYSLRDVQQVVHRLGMVLALLPTDADPLALYAVIAIVLRTVDPDVYQRFVDGEATDKEVADAVFGPRGAASLRSDGRGYGRWLESEIILGILAMRAQPADFDQSKPAEGASPLLDQYRLLSQGATVQGDDVQHAKAVAERVDTQWSIRAFDLMEKSQAFIEAARQLELLSPELGEDGSV